MTSDFYEDEKITTEENKIGNRTAFKRLLPFLKDYKTELIASLIMLGVVTLFSILWPIILQQAMDGPLKEKDYDGIIMAALMIAGIQILSIILQYLMRIKLEIIGQDVMLKLKQSLFDHILSLDISFFDENPVGRLMSRVESDAESIRLLFTNTVVLVVADFLLLFGIYVVLFYYNWRMAAVLFVSIPLVAVLVWIFHRLTTERFFEVRKRIAEVTATLTEYLHGMSIIQIFHRGKYAQQQVNEANRKKFVDDSFVNISVVIFFNTVFFFEYIKIGMVLILGDAFGLSFGTIVMFLLFIWRSFDPIFRVSEQLSNFQKAGAGAKRIFALLAKRPMITDANATQDWESFDKSIKFEKVWFSYSNDDNYVLKDVSFEIQKGKRVALVGVTGGGKSTVISLLLRLYDPQKGRITVDGIDIRDIKRAHLRKKFSLVLQDIILFPGDVNFNIGLGKKNISDKKIVDASRVVDADRFISKLPEKYETTVSEKGANFSRGERQLLSFARALAKDPDILILDEATSSVDPETERTIQSSLKILTNYRTSLIIAHRLSTILDVDEILVLKRGEIIERGSHTELILQDGYYSHLFHLQFKHQNGARTYVK